MFLWNYELNSCFTTIICEHKLNKSVNTSDCERSEGADGVLAYHREAPFTIYSWTIRIMCCVKDWIYIIAICSLVLRRGFLIRCAMLVKCDNRLELMNTEHTSIFSLHGDRLSSLPMLKLFKLKIETSLLMMIPDKCENHGSPPGYTNPPS